MGKLIYSVIASLDGYIEDDTGGFGWGEPDDEVHRFVNDVMRDGGTYLYGRRMYEVMQAWETDVSLAEESPIFADFAALWQAAEKVVYSTTLDTVSTQRTRIERSFDAEDVRRLKASTARDLYVAGAELASRAFAAGLVDECHLFLAPVIVGGGKRALPEGVYLKLELLEERRFASGFVYLRYAAAPSPRHSAHSK